MKKLNRLKIFYQQHILPIVYDYSMSLSEVVQKLVKVVNNLVDEVGDIEDKTGVYDDKIAALESKSADQAVYNDHINTEIDEINNTISKLPTYDVIADIRTDINNINSSVADLDTRVTVLEGQNIYKRLDTAEQNIANLGNDIKSINGDITTIENNISDITSDMHGVKNRIEKLEDCCSDVQGDITTINEDMSDILDDITAIQGDITNINGSVTSIRGDITNLDNRLNSLTLEDLPYIRYTSGNLIGYPWDGFSHSNELVARMCQLIDTHGGYINLLKSDFYFDYDLKSGEFVDYPINQQALSGNLTGSSKLVYIFIPFNKNLFRIDSSYSYTISGNITIRAINGYLRDSANTYNFNNIDIAAYNPQLYKNALGFRLVLTLPAQASATNNTPITAYFSGNGKIRITVL